MFEVCVQISTSTILSDPKEIFKKSLTLQFFKIINQREKCTDYVVPSLLVSESN